MTFVSPVSRANGSTAPPHGIAQPGYIKTTAWRKANTWKCEEKAVIIHRSTTCEQAARTRSVSTETARLVCVCVCVCFRHRHQPTTPTDRPHTSADYGQMITGCQANEPVGTTWALTCPETVHPGVWSGGDAGDGVPPLFFDRGYASPTLPHFFGLKFVQKLVHRCNWLLTKTQCKIISVQQN